MRERWGMSLASGDDYRSEMIKMAAIGSAFLAEIADETILPRRHEFRTSARKTELPNALAVLGVVALLTRAVLWAVVRPSLHDNPFAARAQFLYVTRAVGVIASEPLSRSLGNPPKSAGYVLVPTRYWLKRQAAAVLIFVAAEQLASDVLATRR